MFDAQNLVLLAFLAFDERDRKVFRQHRERLQHVVQRQGEGRRGQRLVQIVGALDALLAGLGDSCERQIADIIEEIRQPDFDFEAANNLLALLARLQSVRPLPAPAQDWISVIAQRFCVSKASREMLCNAAHGDAGLLAAIQAAQALIANRAEQAIGFSVKGSPANAVKVLIDAGSETMNSKLIDLAALLLDQHAAKLTRHPSFAAEVAELKRRFGSTGVRTRLGGANGRAIGGVQIPVTRGRRLAEDAAAPTG